VRTPWSVGITIEKNAPRNTTAIFAPGPDTPNRITRIGRRAIRGNELKKLSHGSRAYCRRRNQPAASPTGMPIAIAARYPSPNSETLAARSS
jgi:hypothetical protein